MEVNRKKILIIHNTLRGWGVERNLIFIGKYADKNIFEVAYLLTTERQNSSENFFDNEVKLLYLKTPQVRQNRYTWIINLILKFIYLVIWLRKNGKDIDYLLVSTLDECIITYIAKKILSLKSKFIVFHQLHFSVIGREKNNPFLNLLLKIIILIDKDANGILCLSKGIAQDLKETHHIKTKIFVHPSCVDFQEIDALSKETLDEPWLLEDERKAIIYVGRLSNKQKRIDILLKAINVIRGKEDLPFKVLIIGDGEDRTFLEKMSKDFDLEGIVYFLGYKENPYKYYAISDLFVLTSDFEGFANVIIEAMACGLPIIATDCPSGPAEILENGKWGILVKRGDYITLANKILHVLQDEEFNKKLRNNALIRVRDFEYKKVFEEFNNFMIKF
ncbi:MAG: glycosyltransferase [bacterium]